MKQRVIQVTAILLTLTALVTFSFEASAAAKKGAKKSSDSGLSTEVHFDGTDVNGRYQTAPEAVSTVEDEKLLEDLLGVREDFKDRLKKMSKRR